MAFIFGPWPKVRHNILRIQKTRGFFFETTHKRMPRQMWTPYSRNANLTLGHTLTDRVGLLIASSLSAHRWQCGPLTSLTPNDGGDEECQNQIHVHKKPVFFSTLAAAEAKGQKEQETFVLTPNESNVLYSTPVKLQIKSNSSVDPKCFFWQQWLQLIGCTDKVFKLESKRNHLSNNNPLPLNYHRSEEVRHSATPLHSSYTCLQVTGVWSLLPCWKSGFNSDYPHLLPSRCHRLSFACSALLETAKKFENETVKTSIPSKQRIIN